MLSVLSSGMQHRHTLRIFRVASRALPAENSSLNAFLPCRPSLASNSGSASCFSRALGQVGSTRLLCSESRGDASSWERVNVCAAEKKPLVLLDLPGVVNSAANMLEEQPWPDYISTAVSCRGKVYTICYSPSVVERLNALSGFCDVVWLTTWRLEAICHLTNVLGMNSFQVALFDKSEVHKAITPGRPLIWIDDQLRPADRELGSGAEWISNRPSGLGLCTNPWTGLTLEDFDLMNDFCECPQAYSGLTIRQSQGPRGFSWWMA
eukprot:gnl/TRDRNA2_/TRDRNA2_40821_c0_seq1.p1 gnl/TRDRNA2_/TRDRNA2_40821_c0~~gnl/TRDRNA2_/TRDRNA2_40821_c0_seq1.p1  ORF type:complete len:265 (+),score=10.94 gnl/TRDRNA2_/TRDRNA2_40821_c0_seq1:76-870(+)